MTVKYIAWPENFVWPYLSQNNFGLYKDIFYIYPPLYFWLLTAWDKIFGISLLSLQSVTYLIIALTDLLLFVTAKRKIWPVVAYIPLQIFFEGNGTWPDQLLTPIFLLCYLAYTSKKYFWLGVFFSLAILTKQTAAYFIFALGIVNIKHWPKIITGFLLPVLITGILLNNSLLDFWQQNFVYIFTYHAGNISQQLWPNITQIIVVALVFLPSLIIGLARKKWLLVFLSITASLGMFTRFSYFHLQPALPFLVLLWDKNIFWVIILIKVFFLNFQSEPKFLEKPVIESAKIINEYIPPGSKTLILNGKDHYYWLTQTIPVGNFYTTSTPWNISYSEDKILNILKTNPPEFVVIRDQNNKISDFIRSKFVKFLELPDGSGIFKNNPVGL